jgi:hypothetical protein
MLFFTRSEAFRTPGRQTAPRPGLPYSSIRIVHLKIAGRPPPDHAYIRGYLESPQASKRQKLA